MSWFGHEAEALARALDLPRVVAERSVESTMDAAHALAADSAPAGTLVLAEEQRRGRGRAGKSWSSAHAAGIYLSLLERPADAAALEVLSLRVGLRIAPVLERWSPAPIQLKWPNDLFVAGAKLAGVLIEARWREQRPDWVVIGMGVNLRAPASADLSASALDGANPLEVLAELLPAARAAAAATGPLTDTELSAFAERDLVRNREILSPAKGTARGITADGAILVESPEGLAPCRAGSLILSS
ncbi:MAG: biotin--[acetyl-CoA-carboxylase] ligase [Gemmatimonadaceae bacterium]|nr:biotin--[acetyl-CoA-carboxylase] ligase [Gemmatimonadaceae bacterium]